MTEHNTSGITQYHISVCVQSLQELVDTAIQSESPHQPQLVISPNWLTGAGTDSQEVWRALQSLGALFLGQTWGQGSSPWHR